MCNLYSINSTQDEVRALSKALRDMTGNMPALPGIFPDYSAPIVRNVGGVRAVTCVSVDCASTCASVVDGSTANAHFPLPS